MEAELNFNLIKATTSAGVLNTLHIGINESGSAESFDMTIKKLDADVKEGVLVLNSQPATGGSGTLMIETLDFKASGKVVEVKITSPGTGYSSIPAVYLSGGGGSSASVTGVRIGPNPVHGGLYKSGPGRITLTESGNTFKGEVEVCEGVLDLNGGTLNNSNLSLSDSGAVINGTVVAASIVKSGAGRAALDTDVKLLESSELMELLKPGLYEKEVDQTGTIDRTTIYESEMLRLLVL